MFDERIEKIVSTNTSLAVVCLVIRGPGDGHLVSIKFISDGSPQEVVIWYRFKVEAERAFDNFTGKHSDKLDVFRVKKFHQYRLSNKDSVIVRSLSVLNLN
jgi:hypothetical protein